jgi:hypothetical protein
MMKKISGNALWLILLAIFLLGGLTVLLTRTGSNTEETGSTEQLSIQAAEILRYAAGIESAVQQLLNRDCSESQISFDDDLTTTGGYENANVVVPASSCHVFMQQGAGFRNTPQKDVWLDTANSALVGYKINYYTSDVRILSVGNDASVAGADLTMLIPYIKQELCAQINKTLGVSVIPEDAGIMFGAPVGYNNRKFIGSYSSTTALGDDAGLPNNSLLLGKKSMCIKVTGAAPAANTYHFYKVLLVR